MSYVNIREVIENKDVEPETYEEWRNVLSSYGGIKWFAENSRTAIPEDEFEDYAREYAEDIGAIDRNMSWPANRIDWEAAANELKMDYFEVEVDGTAYYIRS